MKKQTGITLIALVITIIVILILAGVTISTLTGDNGLLQKAQTAKEQNEEATAIEKIQVEVAGSYKNNGEIDIENQLNQNLQRIAGLKYNGEVLSNTNKITKLPSEVELNGYLYTIQEDGNVEKVIWTQDKTVVTNIITGKTYEVGDIVAYDCGVESYTGQWGILGAENGRLLLMSTVNIGNVTLRGKQDYLTDGTIKLNNACAPYKNEKYATKARSIKVEDINRVTGYIEPATTEYTYTMVDGYVKRNDRDNPSTYTMFEHVDGRKLPDDSSISVVSNSYAYKIYSYISTNSKAFTLLHYDGIYWFDSQVVDAYDSNVRWGFRRYYADGVTHNGNNALHSSYSTYWMNEDREARAVVILKPDIQLSNTVNSSGMYEFN